MQGRFTPTGRERPRSGANDRQVPARLYGCARCRQQTVICSHCDRGQIYCTRSCAQTARRIKQREAGRRYQQSHRGRRHHAARMARYRARRADRTQGNRSASAKKVTHQGPLTGVSCDEQGLDPAAASEGGIPRVRRCHWCAGRCPDHLRMGFLRRRWVRPFDNVEIRRPINDNTS